MKERTTSELIEKLGDDVDRCQATLVDAMNEGEIEPDGGLLADYEYEARQLIRSILAYIEAVTFSVKVTCVERCMKSGIDVSDHERYLAIEVNGALNDKGEVIERSARIRLGQNVRFAFSLLEKASGRPSTFDPSDEWWSCFRETVRVRDRLMHPRMPEDIDISGSDIVNALNARRGFDSVLLTEIERDAERTRIDCVSHQSSGWTSPALAD